MKFDLNDFVTVRLTRKGKLIYYQKALESKQRYVDRLKELNNWQSTEKYPYKKHMEIVNYLNEKSDKYYEQQTDRLEKDGTITLPLIQVINTFGAALFFGKRTKVLKDKIVIDVNSSIRKYFPPEENKLLEMISLQDHLSLQLTDYGASLLRMRNYKGQISDHNIVQISLYDMIKYLYQDTDEYYRKIAQEVSTIPKQKVNKLEMIMRKIS